MAAAECSNFPVNNLDTCQDSMYVALRYFPLHDAAREGDVLLVTHLLQMGYPVNSADYDRTTALHVAALNRQFQVMEILLDNGAEVESVTIDGSTPLCDASAGGDAKCVQLLLENGALVNPKFVFSGSPLHEAALRGHAECVKLLIDYGADLEANDGHFGTPLHAACIRPPSMECVKILLKSGAAVNATKIHSTPLHNAAKINNFDLANLLIKFGAAIRSRDNQGYTPKELTIPGGEVYKLLEYYESNPLTLCESCRSTFWRHSGRQGITLLETIVLPKIVKNYLVFD